MKLFRDNKQRGKEKETPERMFINKSLSDSSTVSFHHGRYCGRSIIAMATKTENTKYQKILFILFTANHLSSYLYATGRTIQYSSTRWRQMAIKTKKARGSALLKILFSLSTGLARISGLCSTKQAHGKVNKHYMYFTYTFWDIDR